jgi:hypothetical protein
MSKRAGILVAGAVAGVLAGAPGCGTSVPEEYRPREGDVIFQSLPRSPLVDAIEGATGSPYSHRGIVVLGGGKAQVLEAFHQVHLTPLGEWIDRGRGDAFTVYRLREDRRSCIPEFVSAARGYLGRPYDLHYSMDDEALYCSELVFKAFRDATGEDLGEVVPLGELNWPPFTETIERLEGGPVPVDRKMITPRALAGAAELEEVVRWGW